MDAYLFAEFIGPFLVGFGALELFWAFYIFYLAFDYIFNAHAPVGLALGFVLLRLAQAIPLAFPFASLFGVLLSFGRLSSDSELRALRTSGIPLRRICATPLALGVLAFLACYALNELVSPPAVDLSTRMFYQMLYHTAALPVENQFFRKDPETGTIFFVNQVLPDKTTILGAQVFKPGKEYYRETDSSKAAHVEGNTLVLTDAIVSLFNDAGNLRSQSHVKSVVVPLPLHETADQFFSSTSADAYTMTSLQLSRQIHLLELQGVGGIALGNLQINLANKSSYPFACIVAVLVALPLAIRFGKQGRMLGIALSIIVFAIYQLILLAATAFGRSGEINPYLASWLPNLIFGTLGLSTLIAEERAVG